MAASWTPWSRTLQRAAISGTVASLLSTLTLAVLGRREAGSAPAPINAVSHWYWGERAARQDRLSLQYTLPGYLTHHAAAIFWALFFERLFGRRTQRAGNRLRFSKRAARSTKDRDCVVDRWAPGVPDPGKRGNLVLGLRGWLEAGRVGSRHARRLRWWSGRGIHAGARGAGRVLAALA